VVVVATGAIVVGVSCVVVVRLGVTVGRTTTVDVFVAGRVVDVEEITVLSIIAVGAVLLGIAVLSLGW